MSFVGTRPEAVKYVKKYKAEYMATLLLPAGITSEASIRYKDEAEYWFFYQNFIYTDENGKRHECEFWGTEEYNQDMYIIESINLRENGQLVKRAIIIKKEKEDFIMV